MRLEANKCPKTFEENTRTNVHFSINEQHHFLLFLIKLDKIYTTRSGSSDYLPKISICNQLNHRKPSTATTNKKRANFRWDTEMRIEWLRKGATVFCKTNKNVYVLFFRQLWHCIYYLLYILAWFLSLFFL